MRLSHFLFYVSTASTFGGLWTMHVHLAPRDLFSWCLVPFSFVCMLCSGLTSTPAAIAGRR
jgi:hypothetical protein